MTSLTELTSQKVWSCCCANHGVWQGTYSRTIGHPLILPPLLLVISLPLSSTTSSACYSFIITNYSKLSSSQLSSFKCYITVYILLLLLLLFLLLFQVNSSSLDPKRAFIQVTHVTPYFTETELAKSPTKFEQENHVSSFVFETPFTIVGQAHGTVSSQCMRRPY